MSIKDYATKELIVSYDASHCIHAAECVRALPAVFDSAARLNVKVGDRVQGGASVLAYLPGRELAAAENAASAERAY